MYLVAQFEPVSDEKGEITIRCEIRSGNNGSLVNVESTKSTTSSVHWCGSEVSESADLIFKLKLISPVRVWLDRTVCSQYSILPRCPSLFNSIPTHNISLSIYTLIQNKYDNELCGIYQVMRKGSSSLLMRLTTMLLFVTASIAGPGNCPLIRMTYVQRTKTYIN